MRIAALESRSSKAGVQLVTRRVEDFEGDSALISRHMEQDALSEPGVLKDKWLIGSVSFEVV